MEAETIVQKWQREIKLLKAVKTVHLRPDNHSRCILIVAHREPQAFKRLLERSRQFIARNFHNLTAGIYAFTEHGFNRKLPVIHKGLIEITDKWRPLKHSVTHPEPRAGIKFADPKKG